MITAIDSNVLIDVFGMDPHFHERSKAALRKCLEDGAVVCSEVVYAELASQFGTSSGLDEAFDAWNIAYAPVEKEAARMAGLKWREYRKNKGKRDRLVADFLIGAHATLQGDRLLTRDRGFYRAYFNKLKIFDPSL